MCHGYSVWQARSVPFTEELQQGTYLGYVAGPLVRAQRPEKEEASEERSLCAGDTHSHEPCKYSIPRSGRDLPLVSVGTGSSVMETKVAAAASGEHRESSPRIARSCHGGDWVTRDRFQLRSMLPWFKSSLECQPAEM